MIAVLISNLFCIAVLLVVIYLLGRPIVRGAIYFPTTPHSVDVMMKLAALRPGQHVADIGSGDGRIVMACAAQGIYAEGYEINPILVWFSRRAIRRAGLQSHATIYWKSFWRIDLGRFDAVFVYGIPYIMKDLARKLNREMKPGAKIISNAFKFREWQPIATEGNILLYVPKP